MQNIFKTPTKEEFKNCNTTKIISKTFNNSSKTMLLTDINPFYNKSGISFMSLKKLI